MKKLLFSFFLFFSISAFSESGIFYSTTTNTFDYKDADGNTIVTIPSNLNMKFAPEGSVGTDGPPGEPGHSPTVGMSGDYLLALPERRQAEQRGARNE